jgi:hypothetical protein
MAFDMDMTTAFAWTTLASAVLIPLLLFVSGYGAEGLSAVFHPRGRFWLAAFWVVAGLQLIAATFSLASQTRVFGEPTTLWAGLIFMVYLWARTLFVLRTRGNPS